MDPIEEKKFIIDYLFIFFKGMSREEMNSILDSYEEAREEKRKAERAKSIEDILFCQAKVLSKGFPEIGKAFEEEVGRIAKMAEHYLDHSGSYLPTVISAINHDGNIPLEELLTSAGIVDIRGTFSLIKPNRWVRHHRIEGQPYVELGSNIIEEKDISPKEALRLLCEKDKNFLPFDIDGGIAIIQQGGIKTNISSYAILLLGSVCEKEAIILRVDPEGEGTYITLVPWIDGIRGAVFIPVSDRSEQLLYY